MSFFKQYRTPFGYVADGNQVDAYGVDHSGFSTRDEVEYQFERQEREKQMADNLKQQGIEPENYPQLGTTFWGNNPENNYGFGTSNISANVENRQNQTPLPKIGNINQNIWNRNQYQTPTPWVKQRASIRNNLSSQSKPVYENPNPRRYSTGEIIWDGVKGFGQGVVSCLENLANKATLGSYNLLEINARDVNQDYLPQKNNFNTNNSVPRYWETTTDGAKVWNHVLQQEGGVIPNSQKPLGYALSATLGSIDAATNYQNLKNTPYSDKYKHALINCKAAQSGLGGYDLVKAFSNFKENRDISSGRNTLDSSQADQYANKIGRLLGTKYPNGDCDVIVQNYINKHY